MIFLKHPTHNWTIHTSNKRDIIQLAFILWKPYSSKAPMIVYFVYSLLIIQNFLYNHQWIYRKSCYVMKLPISKKHLILGLQNININIQLTAEQSTHAWHHPARLYTIEALFFKGIYDSVFPLFTGEYTGNPITSWNCQFKQVYIEKKYIPIFALWWLCIKHCWWH